MTNIPNAALNLVLRESQRQADWHHDTHCQAHTEPLTGSVGCTVWTGIETEARTAIRNSTGLILLTSTEYSLLLSSVNNSNNSPNP